jgi:hypothetical protein
MVVACLTFTLLTLTTMPLASKLKEKKKITVHRLFSFFTGACNGTLFFFLLTYR